MSTERGFSLLTVLIVSTLLLMGSLSTFAQSPYPDDLSYFLNGNNPYSSAVGGQIYRGDGTFYTGTWAGSVSCSTTSPYPCTGGNWTSNGALTSPIEQCLACHYHANSSSNHGAMYLMTGHKNTFRKVASGTPWAGPDGNTYTTADTYYGSGSTYNWTAGTVTVGSCDPFSVPLQLGLTVLDPACSYTGYGSPQSVLYLLGGWMYYGGNSGSGDPQLNTVFDAGAVAGFTGEQYPNGNYDCMRCHATGYNFAAAGSTTGTASTGATSYAGPEPTIAPLSTTGSYTGITDAEFSRWPSDQKSGTSSWYLTGVECERCHNTQVSINSPLNNVSHPSSTGFGGETIPTVATDQASTALCMECHREEIVNTTAKTITPTYPPLAIDTGYCSDFSNNPYSSCTAPGGWVYKPAISHAQGTEFLNSPHAEFTGTLAQNNQNSPDLSIAISGTYSATVATPEGGYFMETSGTDSGQNKGCIGCHDPHYTTVVTPSQYTANPSLFHTLQGTTETNCSSSGCHSNITNNLMATIKHPVGAGTPFPTGTSADVPGACVVCHMQAASPNPSYPTQGVPQNHFFRVSVDPNYYTFPTAAQYYSGTTALNVATDTVTGFTGAIWNDVDIACGQCHAGGTAGQNPYGIAPPNPAPPAFTRTYLATAATGIHGFDTLPTAATPTFSLGSGTYTSAQTVTLSDATSGAAIYYNINTVAPPTASSTKYTAPIVVSSNTTIQAVAEGGIGYNPATLSATASAQYNIQAATPTFSLGPGIYYKPQTLTLSDTTSGAPIYYTTDGSNPTTSPTAILYGGGSITVSVPTTFNVVAGNNAGLIDGTGLTYSSIATDTITIKALPPTFSPGGGTYGVAQTVKITDSASSPGATVYYAFNAAPTTSSTSCSSPCSVPVSVSETLEAVSAFDTSLLSESSVTSATYTFTAPAPTFSPGAGTYRTAQNVVLSDAASATICYTTNGTAPAVNTAGVCTSGSAYSSAIPVGVGSTTIEAVAGGNGYSTSTVVRAIYTIP